MQPQDSIFHLDQADTGADGTWQLMSPHLSCAWMAIVSWICGGALRGVNTKSCLGYFVFEKTHPITPLPRLGPLDPFKHNLNINTILK
jgi:hypothetical protein